MIESHWHTHLIIESAVEEVCHFCNYRASHKVEETEIVWNAGHPLTTYVCCEHFWSNCHNTPWLCGRCGDSWDVHEKEIRLTGYTVYECAAPAGMGDWCGCKRTRPSDWKAKGYGA